jgi:hypothetical protein
MAVDTDLVRLLVGDADPDNQMLTDDQVALVTAQFSSSTLAAAAVADALAGKFSRSVTFSVEGLSIQNSQKAANFRALAQRLRANAVLTDDGALGASVLGISKSQMETVDEDTDRNPSRFKVGMSDFPGTQVARTPDDQEPC